MTQTRRSTSRSFASSPFAAGLAALGMVLLWGFLSVAGAAPGSADLSREQVERAARFTAAGKYDPAAVAYAYARGPRLLADMARAHLRCPGGHLGETLLLFDRYIKEGPKIHAGGDRDLAELRRLSAREKRPEAANLVPRYLAGATDLFKAGEYQRAIESFATAYALEPAPLLLFNIAQVQRKAGHRDEALALYRRFLEEDPNTPMRAEAEGYVAQVQATQEIKTEKAPPPPVVAVAAPRVAPAPIHERQHGRPLRILKWVVGSVGLGLLAAGATLWALDGHQSCALTNGHCHDELDTRTSGIALLVAGGIALGSSGLLFGLDARRDAQGTRIAMLSLSSAF